MTTKLAIVSLALLAPALAAADGHTFHTTGGETQLAMRMRATGGGGLAVRLSDPTRLAFLHKQSSAAGQLHRVYGAELAPGWKLFEGTLTGKWQMSMTVKNGTAGVTLTEWDSLASAPKEYGVHFQLKE